MATRVQFPYRRLRKEQKIIYNSFFRDYFDQEDKAIFIEAPTGSGKTAVLILLMLEEAIPRGLKVIHLVRTRTQIDRVLEELYRFRRSGNQFTYSFLTTREILCPHYKSIQRQGIPEDMIHLICKQKKWKDCKAGSIENLSIPSIRSFLKFCKMKQICPYWSLLSQLRKVDYLVLTYPYAFSFKCRKIAKSINWKNSVVIVDEVHNVNAMIDSESLSKMTLKAVKRRLSSLHERDALKEFSKIRLKTHYVPIKALKYLKRICQDHFEPTIWKCFSKLRHMRFAEECRIQNKLYHFDFDGNVLTWKSCKPLSFSWFRESRLIIGMTGTLPDVNFISLMLLEGKTREINIIRIPRTRDVFIATDISSRYESRENNYRRYAKYIEAIIKKYKDPNKFTLVVFPSYEMMHQVVKFYHHRYAIESRQSQEIDLEGIETFNVVASGKFTEGVEFLDPLKTSRIEAVIIAGLPYPKPDGYLKSQIEHLAQYYSKEFIENFMFNSLMALRVNQAFGRAIRSERDKCEFWILDNRLIYNHLGKWKLKPTFQELLRINSFRPIQFI